MLHRLFGPRFVATLAWVVSFSASANLAVAQTGLSWMNGWWEVRAEDRDRGLVVGMARIATGSRGYVELYLPGEEETQGPFRSSSLEVIDRDGRPRLVAVFDGGTARRVDRLSGLTVPGDTFVIPFDGQDELEVSLSTGLNDLSERQMLTLRDTSVADQLRVELALPQGTSTQSTDALDGLWKVSGEGVGYTRAGVLSPPLLRSPFEMGPETWVRRAPAIRVALSTGYAPLPAGNTTRVTLKLQGHLMPPTGSVQSIRFDDPDVTWANEYRQTSLREAEIEISVRGGLAGRAIPFVINNDDAFGGVWFPEPPGLMPSMAAFVRDFREDQQVATDIAVAGELLRLRAVFADPPMLNVLRFAVRSTAGADIQMVPLYRDNADPKLYVSAPLLVVPEGDQPPSDARLADLGRWAFSARPAVVLDAGPLGGELVAAPEQAGGATVDPVTGVSVVAHPPNLITDAIAAAGRCIAADGTHDEITADDHAALIAFRDALVTRIEGQLVGVAAQTPTRAAIAEAASELLNAAWRGSGHPLARLRISVDGSAPQLATEFLGPSALEAHLGVRPSADAIRTRVEAVTAEALKTYYTSARQGLDGLAALDPCDVEVLLKTLAPLAPEHGNMVGAALLREVPSGDGPRWAPDKVLTARINSFPAVAADIDAQAALSRQQVTTVVTLAGAAFGGYVFLARGAILAGAGAGFGFSQATLAQVGGGLLLATDVVLTGREAANWWEASDDAARLDSLAVFVAPETLAASTRREQEAMYDTLLQAGFTVLGFGFAADFGQVARRVAGKIDGTFGEATRSLAREAQERDDVLQWLMRERDMPLAEAVEELARAEREGLDPLAVVAGLSILDEVPIAARGLLWTPELEAAAMRYMVKFTQNAPTARQVVDDYIRRYGHVPASLFYYGRAGEEATLSVAYVLLETPLLAMLAMSSGGCAVMFSDPDCLADIVSGPREPRRDRIDVDDDPGIRLQTLTSAINRMDSPAPTQTTPIEPDTQIEVEAATANWQPVGEALIAEGLEGVDMIAPRGLYYGTVRDMTPAVVRAGRSVLRDGMSLRDAMGDDDARAFLTEVFGETFVNETLAPAVDALQQGVVPGFAEP